MTQRKDGAERIAEAVQQHGAEAWTTPWGTCFMQGETQGVGGGPRFHFAQWHSEANPPEEMRSNRPEGFRRDRVHAAIDKWLRNGVRVTGGDERKKP